jgi:ligand-binding sensor domain-containing protein
MKKNKINIKMIVALLMLSFQLNAQSWQNITYSTNGLPSNNLSKICSDKQGSIWLATADSGLTNLKLGKFRTWRDKDRLQSASTYSIYDTNNSRIASKMIKDTLNNLFFTSTLVDINSNKKYGIVKFDSTFHFIKSPYSFEIFPLVIDKKGNIWCVTGISSGYHGVIKYSPNGLWQNYTKVNSGLFSNDVSDISVDAFGNIWFSYNNENLLTRYNGINWKSYTNKDFSFGSKILKSDLNGNVFCWAQGGVNDLYQYNKSLDSLIKRADVPENYESPIGIDKSNNLWTTGYNSSTNSISLYKNTPPNWYTTNFVGLDLKVKSIYFDNTNYAWLTDSKGLFRINGLNVTQYTKDNCGLLSNNTIEVIKGAISNQLIIAHGNGFSVLNTVSKKSKVYDEYNTGLYDNKLDNIFIDSKNNKWIHGAGIQKLLPNNNDWIYYSYDSLKHSKNICEDIYGNMWFSDPTGVSVIKNNSIINYEISQITKNNYIQSMSTDLNGNIFILHFGGIEKFNGSSWSSLPKSNSIITSNIVTDKLGNLWTDCYTSTPPYFGLAKYNGSTWNYYLGGLSSAPINIYSDRYNHIWISYRDSGISCYDGQLWKNYNVANSGILSNNINSVHVDSLGKIWFATDKGISILTPSTTNIDQTIKEGNNIIVFPNPSNGKMFLKVNVNNYNLIEINAINILGERSNIKYNLVENGLLELNIPENVTGIFTFEIKIDAVSYFEKVSIMK